MLASLPTLSLLLAAASTLTLAAPQGGPIIPATSSPPATSSHITCPLEQPHCGPHQFLCGTPCLDRCCDQSYVNSTIVSPSSTVPTCGPTPIAISCPVNEIACGPCLDKCCDQSYVNSTTTSPIPTSTTTSPIPTSTSTCGPTPIAISCPVNQIPCGPCKDHCCAQSYINSTSSLTSSSSIPLGPGPVSLPASTSSTLVTPPSTPPATISTVVSGGVGPASTTVTLPTGPGGSCTCALSVVTQTVTLGAGAPPPPPETVVPPPETVVPPVWTTSTTVSTAPVLPASSTPWWSGNGTTSGGSASSTIRIPTVPMIVQPPVTSTTAA